MIAGAISEVELRRANVAVIERYLEAWSVLDIDAIEAALHPEVELELGYAAPGVQDSVNGKASVMEFMRIVPTVVAPMNFFATYRGDSRVLATDKPYRNRYLTRARVEDGLIRRYAEFSDPLVFMEAFKADD